MSYLLKIIGVVVVGIIFFVVKILSYLPVRMKQFDNLEKLRQAQKIAIIGCPGSGKTYVTFKLQKKLQLPVYHLDQYAWLPNWCRIPDYQFRAIHANLCKQDQWIIEGIYFRHVPERIACADAIIFLDISRSVCVWNVFKRALWNHGKIIDGNPEGCVQNMLSWKFVDFVRYIWSFNTKHRGDVVQQLHEASKLKPVYVLRSMAEVNEFLKQI